MSIFSVFRRVKPLAPASIVKAATAKTVGSLVKLTPAKGKGIASLPFARRGKGYYELVK